MHQYWANIMLSVIVCIALHKYTAPLWKWLLTGCQSLRWCHLWERKTPIKMYDSTKNSQLISTKWCYWLYSLKCISNTPFTPTHGCCGSRRMLYPSRSTRGPYAYCIRNVSVDFCCDPLIRSPILKVISCFTYAVDAADNVSPYWLRTLSVLPLPASVLCPRCPYSPPSKLECGYPPSLLRQYRYSTETIQKYVHRL